MLRRRTHLHHVDNGVRILNIVLSLADLHTNGAGEALAALQNVEPVSGDSFQVDLRHRSAASCMVVNPTGPAHVWLKPIRERWRVAYMSSSVRSSPTPRIRSNPRVSSCRMVSSAFPLLMRDGWMTMYFFKGAITTRTCSFCRTRGMGASRKHVRLTSDVHLRVTVINGRHLGLKTKTTRVVGEKKIGDSRNIGRGLALTASICSK